MMDLRLGKVSQSSSRILYDIPCNVCQDHSSGKHYGIFACDGCAGFFKRSIRRNRQYVCRAKSEGRCMVDKTHRNQCRACRLRKCVESGMNKDAVQHERGPRNSTLRRQMSLYFKDEQDEHISNAINNMLPSRSVSPADHLNHSTNSVSPGAGSNSSYEEAGRNGSSSSGRKNNNKRDTNRNLHNHHRNNSNSNSTSSNPSSPTCSSSPLLSSTPVTLPFSIHNNLGYLPNTSLSPMMHPTNLAGGHMPQTSSSGATGIPVVTNNNGHGLGHLFPCPPLDLGNNNHNGRRNGFPSASATMSCASTSSPSNVSSPSSSMSTFLERMMLRPPIPHPLFCFPPLKDMLQLQQYHQTSLNLLGGGLPSLLPQQPSNTNLAPSSSPASPPMLNPANYQIHQFPLSHQNLRFPFANTKLEGNQSESAARLILMNVKWIKSVPAFVSLPMRDQFLLLEESWRELFVLGASQFNLPLNLEGIIDGRRPSSASSSMIDNNYDSETEAADAEMSTSPSPQQVKHERFVQEIKSLQETIEKFRELDLDQTEFACLRAIILFKLPSPADLTRSLKDSKTISSLQDQAQLTLNKYISIAFPTQPFRFGKLLLLLPLLKSVSGSTIEKLFFKHMIRSNSIETLICNAYKDTL